MRYFYDTEFHEDGKTIELISIGIVASDGREFYAEVDLPAAAWSRIYEHEWLVANVVPYLSGPTHTHIELQDDIRRFITGNNPEFWAYMGAYDWVVLNQLYGPMVDHPKKWPFYSNDIAQLCLHHGINHRDLPKQTTVKHNSMSDARWVQDSYNWVMNLVRDYHQAIVRMRKEGLDPWR